MHRFFMEVGGTVSVRYQNDSLHLIMDFHLDRITREAIKLGYRIEPLGYYNIHDHGENFLYSPKSRRVYAIDCDQLTRISTGKNYFRGEIRDLN